jgi:integrase
MEYATINNYRSAISAYHQPIEGMTAGSHHRVSELLAGISNLRPPKPICNTVWDVEVLLKYIKQLPQTYSQTVMQTTLKTVTLLALASTSRASELHKLDLSCLISQSGKSTFQIPGRVKHSKKGKPNPPLIFTEFQTDPDLCPVKAIETYIAMSKPWRQSCGKTQLFLATITPHGPVAKTTISNWVKKTLVLAGITGFTGHSTRSAASSKAKDKGISLETILERGNWNSKSVWEKHYHKTVSEPATVFQKAVLS